MCMYICMIVHVHVYVCAHVPVLYIQYGDTCPLLLQVTLYIVPNSHLHILAQMEKQVIIVILLFLTYRLTWMKSLWTSL